MNNNNNNVFLRTDLKFTCFNCERKVANVFGRTECCGVSLCKTCKQTINHPHTMECSGSMANEPTQEEQITRRNEIIEYWLKSITHSYHCRNSTAEKCQFHFCKRTKKILLHSAKCEIRLMGGCVICKHVTALLSYHSSLCQSLDCPVPSCERLKIVMMRQPLEESLDNGDFGGLHNPAPSRNRGVKRSWDEARSL